MEEQLLQEEDELQGTYLLNECNTSEEGSGSLKLTILLNCIGILVACTCASLLTRYYFQEGGSSRWLTTLTQSAGWPLLVLTSILISSSKNDILNKIQFPGTKLILVYAAMGCFQTTSNLAYAWGSSYLPASTSGVLASTQLLFNVAFSMLLLKHKPSKLAWASILAVTSSAILLALDSSKDSVPNVTNLQHAYGFLAALFSSFSCGLTYVLIELIFAKFPSCSSNPLQVTAWILFFSTFIPLGGLVMSGELRDICQESQTFGGGSLAYYSVLLLTILGWPTYATCSTILINIGSSVLVGVTQAALIPIVPVFAVLFFHDHFGVLKALSTLLAVAGFAAYMKVVHKA